MNEAGLTINKNVFIPPIGVGWVAQTAEINGGQKRHTYFTQRHSYQNLISMTHQWTRLLTWIVSQ